MNKMLLFNFNVALERELKYSTGCASTLAKFVKKSTSLSKVGTYGFIFQHPLPNLLGFIAFTIFSVRKYSNLDTNDFTKFAKRLFSQSKIEYRLLAFSSLKNLCLINAYYLPHGSILQQIIFFVE